MPPLAPIVRPAASASAVFGRTPMPSRTRSAGSRVPSARTTAVALLAASLIVAIPRPSSSRTPWRSISRCRGSAISGSKKGMTCSFSSTTETLSPRRTNCSATSNPM